MATHFAQNDIFKRAQEAAKRIKDELKKSRAKHNF